MSSHVSVYLNGLSRFTCRVSSKLHIIAYEPSLTHGRANLSRLICCPAQAQSYVLVESSVFCS